MEQNIEPVGASGSGLLGGALDAGRRCKLVGGSRDLEAKVETAVRILIPLASLMAGYTQYDCS